MATQPANRYTLEEYLELEDTLDYRREFHDGLILPVEAATYQHSCLAMQSGSLLRTAFPRCSVSDSSLNLYIPLVDRVLHPDVTVLCGKPNFAKPNCIDNPFIVVEITSPTTKDYDYDYGTKREHYFHLASLHHYLLVSQTEPLVAHYERSGIGWNYVDRGADAIVFLADVQIPVADIYKGISLG